MTDLAPDAVTTILHKLQSRFATWTRSGRSPSFLLTVPELEEVEIVYGRLLSFRHRLTPTLAEFIAASGYHHVSQAYKAWLQADRQDMAFMDSASWHVAEGWAKRLPAEQAPVFSEELEFMELSRAALLSKPRTEKSSARASATRIRPVELTIEHIGRDRSHYEAEQQRREKEHQRAEKRREKDHQRSEKQRVRSEALMEKRRKSAVAGSKLDTARLAASFEAPAVDSTTHRPEAADLVDVSVFAPSRTNQGSDIIIQVMLHEAGSTEPATTRAGLIDETAVLRGTSSLQVDLKRGTRVTISLSEPGLSIEQPSQTAIWNGKLTSVSIIAKVPPGTVWLGDNSLRVLFPTVRIAIGPAIIGEVRFKLSVAQESDPEGLGQQQNCRQPGSATRYRRVFFSYSSKDRAKALEVAQSYRAAGIDFFQDILTLEPGQRWENGLYREIDNCDLFLLLWSENARGSEWVEKEARYALERREQSNGLSPDMVPLILEGPPAPKPPAFLSHLHFDDWMRYAIASTNAPLAAADGEPASRTTTMLAMLALATAVAVVAIWALAKG